MEGEPRERESYELIMLRYPETVSKGDLYQNPHTLGAMGYKRSGDLTGGGSSSAAIPAAR